MPDATPIVQFVPLDWIWTGLFVALMIACGAIFYRLGKRSEADFFLAGRGLPWWLPATSVYATHTATDTPMWITGVIYAHGLRGALQRCVSCLPDVSLRAPRPVLPCAWP